VRSHRLLRGKVKGRQTIGACLIVKDEEDRIGDALRSVSFCDEVVVVDSGSSDRTREIAREAGAKVIENPWPGFAAQRNVALDSATSEWILEVDADERITPELRAEILDFLRAPPDDVDIGALPMRQDFLGGTIAISAKYPTYRYRLFRRANYRHDETRTVHEGLWANGRTWAFDGDMEHVLAGDWREAFRDAWNYSRLEAGQLTGEQTAGAYAKGILLRPPAKFLYRMLVDGGWRDGWRGAVKVGLDCAADAWVWLRRLVGRTGDLSGDSGVAPGIHFGYTRHRIGPVRLVAVASGPDATASAVTWLRAAQSAGADVALVTDSAPQGEDRGLHVRALGRFSPLRLIRAMSAEEQLRPIDGILVCGSRARRLAPLLPRQIAGDAQLIDPSEDPGSAEKRVRAAMRESAPDG